MRRADAHVVARSDVLAQVGRSVRVGIEQMQELEDPASVDVLTEMLRGVDRSLWFVDPHVAQRRDDAR